MKNQEVASEMVKAFTDMFIGTPIPGKFAIFGSAAIALRGVDLGRPVADLDILIEEETRYQFREELEECGVDIGPDDSELAGVTIAEVLAEATQTEGSFGWPVATLDHLMRWKKAFGRPKDLLDVETMKARGK